MKKVLWIAGAIAVLAAVFFALNSYLYNEKQASDATFPDGEYLGFIRGLTDQNSRADFDDALWLTGTEAQNAAIEEGLCTEETRGECNPNDFFIKNTDKTTASIPISGGAKIYMQTWKMEEFGNVEEREITLGEFAEAINNSALYWRNLPYRIVVEGGEITKIAEVYLP